MFARFPASKQQNIYNSLTFGHWTLDYNLLKSRFVQDDNLNSNLNIQVI
jgi:hypothetical protein